MLYDDDFYEEPSEFEIQIDEFKESLAKSVKNEFLEEMEQLRNENKKLQGIKEHFDQIKRDYERKKQECDRAIYEAERKAKHMRAEEVMEHYSIFCWGITWKNLYGPKCDNCDRDRKIEIVLPSGKKVADDCECSNSAKTVIVPKRMLLYELSDRDGEIVAWYQACGKENDRYYKLEYASSVYAKRIIESGTSFCEVDKIDTQRDILFYSKDECRAYCKYLNDKNGIPGDTLYECNGNPYKEKEE